MKLYSYFRSSAAYRVRIGLECKGLTYEIIPVHLLRGGGQQHAADYHARNPQDLVPTLIDGESVITQSLAILEYLEEVHPDPPLLPKTPEARARVRALAEVVACDLHPLNNLRVLQYVTGPLGHSEAEKLRWIQHWTRDGLAAFEALVCDHPDTGRFCHGEAPTLADCCLIPQLFHAERFGCDLVPYPTLLRIRAACESLPAFQKAHPGRQPDAE